MSGLKFFWGDHTHAAGEVYPREISYLPLISPRGRRWGTRARFNIEGNFNAPTDEPLTPELVNQKIATLENKYSQDYKDCGFRFADNTLTQHVLTSNSQFNLTGNRVLYRSWLHKSAAELANTRSYAITIGADFLDSTQNLIEFQERVRFLGDGTADWDFRQRWIGDPERVEYSEKTPIRVIQQGTLVSILPYPNPPDPLWPDNIQGKHTVIERTSPHDHGNPAGDRLTHYRVSWTYRFAFIATMPTGNPNEYTYLA